MSAKPHVRELNVPKISSEAGLSPHPPVIPSPPLGFFSTFLVLSFWLQSLTWLSTHLPDLSFSHPGPTTPQTDNRITGPGTALGHPTSSTDSGWQPRLHRDSVHSGSSKFTWESQVRLIWNVRASAFLDHTYATVRVSSSWSLLFVPYLLAPETYPSSCILVTKLCRVENLGLSGTHTNFSLS